MLKLSKKHKKSDTNPIISELNKLWSYNKEYCLSKHKSNTQLYDINQKLNYMT